MYVKCLQTTQNVCKLHKMFANYTKCLQTTQNMPCTFKMHKAFTHVHMSIYHDMKISMMLSELLVYLILIDLTSVCQTY